MTSAAPVPMGAAYSPSTSEIGLRFRMPPLRRVREMVSDTGTADASHRGMAVYGWGYWNTCSGQDTAAMT